MRKPKYHLLKKTITLLLAAIAPCGTLRAEQEPPATMLGAANHELVSFHKQFDQAAMIPVADNVHMAFAYEYANLSFIEGDDGVIAIDAGFYPNTTRRALDDYRKITSKPIKAVIYTHIHLDHTGGIDGLLEEHAERPTIYGPANWEHFVSESTSVLMPMVMWRAFAQNGVLLPRGEHGAVGAGIGPVPTMQGIARIEPPHINIGERTRLNIAGVDLELIPTPGDIASSHMMVWLPDQKVLFAGDTLGGTFPYMETSRFELDRDPAGFVTSLNLALGLEPEHVIAGHGRLLTGRSDVEDVLSINRDVIQFMIDQVERWIAKGHSADQIIDAFELPAVYAEHPDLQPHYHRIEWMIRGMYLKRAGFVGDVMDLSRHTDSEQARRLIPLIGGEAATIEAAQKALQDGDPRWAASLAGYVLQVNPERKAAQQLRLAAFNAIAANTNSSNERNRLLSELLRETGHINWTHLVQQVAFGTYQQQSVEALLDLFRIRVRPERAEGKNMIIKIAIENEDEDYYWSLNNSVLRRVQTAPSAHGTLALSKTTLLEIFVGKTDWQSAINAGKVSATGEAESFIPVIE